MNWIMYLLLIWYTLIMFLKVLSHLILKIKSFVKYFKKRVWNISKFSWFFFNFKVKYFIVHLYIQRWFTRLQTVTHPGRPTSRVWRSATTLIEANALLLSQTSKPPVRGSVRVRTPAWWPIGSMSCGPTLPTGPMQCLSTPINDH